MELIFIDNGSDQETLDFLEKTEKEHPFVQVVRNKENRGFAAANNQGLDLAAGEFIIYLNNDTIVTNNWIESLVSHFRINRSIGLLCPVTNATGNEACVKKGYEQLEDLQRFAFQLAQDKGKSIMELRCVPLYCAMIRTSVARQIGGLNEEYTKGMFEDDELSARVRQAGYLTACAEDVFVHHFGRASFKMMPKTEYDELFKRNRAIFESKWGPWVPHIRGWFNSDMELRDIESD
jgi:GT2 family glycosyltransferase